MSQGATAGLDLDPLEDRVPWGPVLCPGAWVKACVGRGSLTSPEPGQATVLRPTAELMPRRAWEDVGPVLCIGTRLRRNRGAAGGWRDMSPSDRSRGASSHPISVLCPEGMTVSNPHQGAVWVACHGPGFTAAQPCVAPAAQGTVVARRLPGTLHTPGCPWTGHTGVSHLSPWSSATRQADGRTHVSCP